MFLGLCVMSNVSTFEWPACCGVTEEVISLVGKMGNIGASSRFRLGFEKLSEDVTVSCWKNNVICQSGKQRCKDSSFEATSYSSSVKNVRCPDITKGNDFFMNWH